MAAAAINVGVGSGGPFAETRLEDDLRLVDPNVRSSVHLAKLVVHDMVAARAGRILFSSSIPTDTNFFARARLTDTKLGRSKKDDPPVVAEEGFAALMRGKDHVVTGAMKNQLFAAMSKVAPKATKARLHRGLSKPGAG